MPYRIHGDRKPAVVASVAVNRVPDLTGRRSAWQRLEKVQNSYSGILYPCASELFWFGLEETMGARVSSPVEQLGGEQNSGSKRTLSLW